MKNIKPLYLYLLTGIIAFIVYYNSLENDFVFDDDTVVLGDRAITNIYNIPKFFTAEEGFHKVIGRYYRPVVSSSYAIDYFLWGTVPMGFHLTNIIIHVISCLLILRILILLFGNYKNGLLASLIGAIIFAVHPVHTEAVTWVSGRTDSMAAMFFFASFIYFLKLKGYGVNKEELTSDKFRINYLVVSLIFYFFGLLSKEMIMTMPVLLLIFDITFGAADFRKNLKRNILIYLYYTAVSVLYLVLRYFVLKDIGDRLTYLYFYGKPALVAFLTMLKTIPVYFRLLIAPVNLLYHYNGTIPDAESFFDIGVIVSVIFVLGIIIAGFLFLKKFPVFSFCIFFFLVSLLPVMNIVPTMNLMAERFLYITSLIIPVFVSYIIIRFGKENIKHLLNLIFIAVIILFSYKTFQRNKDWKNNETLYTTGEGIDGSVLLVNAGNLYANKKNYDEAEKRYRRAIEIRDNSVLAHHNLGLVFLIKGKTDSAEIKFKKGLEIDSLAPDGYLQLANLYVKQGRKEEAIRNLEKLQTIVPDYRGSASLLQSLKMSPDNIQGDIPPSADINPARLDSLEKASYANYQSKNYREAIKNIEELMKLNPKSTSGYYNNIALCYESLGDFVSAEKAYLNAIKTDSKNINALNGVVGIYLKRGDKAKSVFYLNKILELNPDNTDAVKKLDSLKNLR